MAEVAAAVTAAASGGAGLIYSITRMQASDPCGIRGCQKFTETEYIGL